jgi:hypothetical protein
MGKSKYKGWVAKMQHDRRKAGCKNATFAPEKGLEGGSGTG